MAHLIQVPAFTPADPANVTGAEWTAFQNAADFADGQLHVGMALLPGPAYNHPAMPQAYTNNPGNPTARLAAAGATITHLNGLVIRLMTAHHAAALALAQAQAGGQQAAPPAPPPPAAPRIKATTPTKFGGKTLHARTFIAECDNYYALVPMTDEQRIRFALQLIDEEGAGWKRNQLGLLGQVQPPAHLATWVAFVAEFNLRFADPEEQKKAAALLNHGKVIQTTSVREFIDRVNEKCDLAHYDGQEQRMDIIEAGLKPDLARAVTAQRFANYQDYVQVLISTDEVLQRLRTKEQKKTFGSSNATASGSNSTKSNEKPRVDNSKFKLSEEEKKEHMDGHLCFKCHKPGHGSKDCKNPRTVYSDVRKVAEVKVKVEEINEEDFSDRN